MKLEGSFWADVLVSGLTAGIASALAASAFTRLNHDHAARAMNAVAHIYDGGPIPSRDGPSHRNTLIGTALHVGASVWWAVFFEGIFGKRAGKSASAAAAGAACVATAAYVVDYHVVHERFRPGFEKHLKPMQMLGVYAALAAGLALAARLRRLRHHQVKNRDEREESRPPQRRPDRVIALELLG